MILSRAREILNSPSTIHVFHKNMPIWIERLNAEEHTAVVTSTTGQYTVPVDELIEK